MKPRGGTFLKNIAVIAVDAKENGGAGRFDFSSRRVSNPLANLSAAKEAELILCLFLYREYR